MRLDHLLSKEQCEGETRSAHPKVDRSESFVKECRKTQKLFLLAVSFSGFALSARLRKPSAEDLDNCTLENEFFLKASQEGKEAAEMQKKTGKDKGLRRE